MQEIKLHIQGVSMTRQPNGEHHLLLIAPNSMEAEILQQTIGNQVFLSYTYDGSDVTFYLVFQLPHINKLFKIAVNALPETLKWLNYIDDKKVTAIRIAYRDGKGGIIPFGGLIGITL
jgi:hypothetical protein